MTPSRRIVTVAAAGPAVSAGLAVPAVLGGLAVLAGPAAAATAPPATATTPPAVSHGSCRSYPRPGTTSRGPVPALVRAQYGALRRPRRPRDRVAVAKLGRLPQSGIVATGIRLLGTVPSGGRAYLVPSLHLLAAPMKPARCVPLARRVRQRSLLATLRREYARRGLCLSIVYRRGAVVSCAAAPGTVAALVHGPGLPTLGLAPDGVASVTVHFRGRRSPLRARVRGNLWSLPASVSRRTACGLGWSAAGGVVLRTVRRCTPDTS